MTMAYVSVGLTEEARAALRAAPAKLIAHSGQRVNMSEALLAALAAAEQDPAAWVRALRAGTSEDAR